MSSAAQYSITINQYADFSRSFVLKQDDVVVNLTDYSFAGSLKKHHSKTTDVDFTAEITNAGQGAFTISLTDVQTSTMDPGEWHYDLVMTDDNGLKTRIMEGVADVRPGITS